MTIRLCEPDLSGNETVYVLDALGRNQLSGASYLRRFEAEWQEWCGAPYAVACSSGTAALHLLLLALDVQAGDEVIVPALTYIATANAVVYCGGTPVAVDVDPATWTLDPQAVAAAITPRTVGILAVDLYGVPARLDTLTLLADAHDLWLAVDAAEGIGALYGGRTTGTWGLGAAYSLYGNKTLTTGEGGMVTTRHAWLAERMRMLRGQGADPKRRYYHIALGYNYRLTELQAAVGLAQVEQAERHIGRRRERLAWYQELLPEAHGFHWQQTPMSGISGAWLAALTLEQFPADGIPGVMAHLAACGIETRPIFPPLPRQPVYAAGMAGARTTNANLIADYGLCLPLHAGLSHADVQQVCQALRKVCT